MNPEKAIRTEARSILRNGNWPVSVGAFFVLFSSLILALFAISVVELLLEASLGALLNYLAGINPVFSIESETSLGSMIYSDISGLVLIFMFILSFVFVFMIYCGIKRFFYKLSINEKADFHEIFYCFSKGKKKRAIGFAMGYGFTSFLKLLLCEFLPIVISVYTASHDLPTSSPVNETVLIGSIALAVGGFLLWILWTSRYFLAFYIFNENENLSLRECKRHSARILKGKLTASTNKLIFSFAGWFLFALTGVGMIYFVPYFETTTATSAKWILKLDKEVY